MAIFCPDMGEVQPYNNFKNQIEGIVIFILHHKTIFPVVYIDEFEALVYAVYKRLSSYPFNINFLKKRKNLSTFIRTQE